MPPSRNGLIYLVTCSCLISIIVMFKITNILSCKQISDDISTAVKMAHFPH